MATARPPATPTCQTELEEGTMPLFGPPDVNKLAANGDVPGLIGALGYAKSWPVQSRAASALGKSRDPRAVEPLILALRDKMVPVRERAAEALGRLGDPRAVEPLIVLLGEPSISLRKIAAVSLGQIRDPRAVEPLIVLLGDQDKDLRQTVTLVLGQLALVMGQIHDPSAVDPLIVLLGNKNKDLRKTAAVSLGQIGDARAVEPLVAVLYDDPAAVAALVRIGAPSVKLLIESLRSGYDFVREPASTALIEIGCAAELIIPLLGDKNEAVRKTAAETLTRLGWQPGTPQERVACWIARGEWDECVKIGAVAVEPLVGLLTDSSLKVRKGAMQALGQLRDPRAIEPLARVFEKSDPDVRRSVVEALGQFRGDRAFGPLIDALGDGDHGVRSAAADALHRLGWNPDSAEAGARYWVIRGDWSKCVEIGTPAVEAVTEALKYGNAGVREFASIALVEIGAPAIEALVAVLARNDREERRAAAEALMAIYRSGKLGPEQRDLVLAQRPAIMRATAT
jgi:HEAT repeat protein